MKQAKPIWKPTVDNNRKLVGPYPETIDLTDAEFPDLDFSQKSCLIISDDPGVRRITLPIDVIGVDYLVISDLPALEEITLVGSDLSELFVCYQWVSVTNVPSLRRVFLSGEVRSLAIEGANSLENLDVSGCPGLDLVKVIGAPSRLRVNVLGCLKLRDIVGVDTDLRISSGLTEQIQANQKDSRFDGSLYRNMTFTDIELVTDLINEGVKAMSRDGRMASNEGSLLGYYDILACDPKFKPFNYRLLNPLESVYTGGTGETYAYVFIQRYVCLEDFTVKDVAGAGNRSPEYCLSYILDWIRMEMSHLPIVESASDDHLLEILKDAAERTPIDTIRGLPIRVSSLIDFAEAQAFCKLAEEVGMSVADRDGELYVYVYPESGIPPEEEPLYRSSVIGVPMPKALGQMARLKQFNLARSSQ